MTEVLGFAAMPRFTLRTLLTSVTAFCVVLTAWLFLTGAIVAWTPEVGGPAVSGVRIAACIGALAAVGVTLVINQQQPSESKQPILAEAALLSAMCLMISVVTVPMAMLVFGT